MKETVQESAVDGVKADLQLHERASMPVSLNQCASSTEIWGIAALEQRRDAPESIWPRSRLGARAGSSITGITTTCWAAFFDSWWNLRRKCYRFAVHRQSLLPSGQVGGKGIDICAEIVEIARQRNPFFEFAGRVSG